MALELDLVTTDPMQRMQRRLAELEKRVLNLERKRLAVPIPPSGPNSIEGGEGSLAANFASASLGNFWIRMNGRWYGTTVSSGP